MISGITGALLRSKKPTRLSGTKDITCLKDMGNAVAIDCEPPIKHIVPESLHLTEELCIKSQSGLPLNDGKMNLGFLYDHFVELNEPSVPICFSIREIAGVRQGRNENLHHVLIFPKQEMRGRQRGG
jgi:hypothetical protein